MSSYGLSPDSADYLNGGGSNRRRASERAGEYVILFARTFYAASGTRGVVMDDDYRRALRFPSRAAALAEIARLDAERYVQAHNEYGRPTYRAAPVTRLPKWAENCL